MDSQIKSESRVRDLGEVYTNRREVDAMLDLVGETSYKMSARIFEPSCGNGNFLAAILDRKLETVKRINERHRGIKRFEYNIIKCLSSIYAIDICAENVSDSRQRLYQKVKDFYSEQKNTSISSEGFYDSVGYILEKNIIAANSLDDQDEILFSEFKKVSSNNYALQESIYPYREIGKKNAKPVEVKSEKPYLSLYKNGGLDE